MVADMSRFRIGIRLGFAAAIIAVPVLAGCATTRPAPVEPLAQVHLEEMDSTGVRIYGWQDDAGGLHPFKGWARVAGDSIVFEQGFIGTAARARVDVQPRQRVTALQLRGHEGLAPGTMPKIAAAVALLFLVAVVVIPATRGH